MEFLVIQPNQDLHHILPYSNHIVVNSDGSLELHSPLDNRVHGWGYSLWRRSEDISISWEVLKQAETFKLEYEIFIGDLNYCPPATKSKAKSDMGMMILFLSLFAFFDGENH